MSKSSNGMTFGICQQSYGYSPQPAIGEEPGPATKPTFDLCQNLDGAAGPFGSSFVMFGPQPVVVPDPALIIINATIAALAQEARDIFRTGTNNNEIYFRYALQSLRDRQSHQRGEFSKLINQMQASFSDAPGPLNGAGYLGDSVIENTFRENLINANQNASVSYMNNKETLAVSDGDFTEAKVSFNMKAAKFEEKGSLVVSELVDVSDTDVPLGYARKRQSDPRFAQNTTAVVLKASVRPRLLFWPRSLTPTITAVAAAKPFGSKIGPPEGFYNEENPQFGNADDVANMSLYLGDHWSNSGSSMPGLGHINFARSVLSLLPSGMGSGVNTLRPDASGGCPNSFGCLARAPTHFEGIMFNTFVPTAGPQFDLAMTDLGQTVPLAGTGYQLGDRPGNLSGLHNMDFAGINPYYATAESSLTSWAPVEAVTDPTLRRIGYSIKLMPIALACEELEVSGAGSELSYFCQPENAVLH